MIIIRPGNTGNITGIKLDNLLALIGQTINDQDAIAFNPGNERDLRSILRQSGLLYTRAFDEDIERRRRIDRART